MSSCHLDKIKIVKIAPSCEENVMSATITHRSYSTPVGRTVNGLASVFFTGPFSKAHSPRTDNKTYTGSDNNCAGDIYSDVKLSSR